ncbi:MAG: hypothetical protein LC107_06645 [Chitinophagales bacterium]|nr:hypothetical protein [Chitinophagales bacterium]
MKYISFFLILLTIAIASCTKETPRTLEYPTTFTFNTPLLDDRGVFVIENGGNNTWTFKQIIDELGSFNRSDAVISDTLNQMIREEFSNNMISKITLLSPNQMEITRARLILNPSGHLKDSIEVIQTETVNYQANGNVLMPGMFLTNEFRDIYICNEFIYANARINPDSLYFGYFRNDCNGRDYNGTLNNFVRNNNFLKFDTASVEYINYIFSSYK